MHPTYYKTSLCRNYSPNDPFRCLWEGHCSHAHGVEELEYFKRMKRKGQLDLLDIRLQQRSNGKSCPLRDNFELSHDELSSPLIENLPCHQPMPRSLRETDHPHRKPPEQSRKKVPRREPSQSQEILGRKSIDLKAQLPRQNAGRQVCSPNRHISLTQSGSCERSKHARSLSPMKRPNKPMWQASCPKQQGSRSEREVRKKLEPRHSQNSNRKESKVSSPSNQGLNHSSCDSPLLGHQETVLQMHPAEVQGLTHSDQPSQLVSPPHHDSRPMVQTCSPNKKAFREKSQCPALSPLQDDNVQSLPHQPVFRQHKCSTESSIHSPILCRQEDQLSQESLGFRDPRRLHNETFVSCPAQLSHEAQIPFSAKLYTEPLESRNPPLQHVYQSISRQASPPRLLSQSCSPTSPSLQPMMNASRIQREIAQYRLLNASLYDTLTGASEVMHRSNLLRRLKSRFLKTEGSSSDILEVIKQVVSAYNSVPSLAALSNNLPDRSGIRSIPLLDQAFVGMNTEEDRQQFILEASPLVFSLLKANLIREAVLLHFLSPLRVSSGLTEFSMSFDWSQWVVQYLHFFTFLESMYPVIRDLDHAVVRMLDTITGIFGLMRENFASHVKSCKDHVGETSVEVLDELHLTSFSAGPLLQRHSSVEGVLWWPNDRKDLMQACKRKSRLFVRSLQPGPKRLRVDFNPSGRASPYLYYDYLFVIFQKQDNVRLSGVVRVFSLCWVDFVFLLKELSEKETSCRLRVLIKWLRRFYSQIDFL